MQITFLESLRFSCEVSDTAHRKIQEKPQRNNYLIQASIIPEIKGWTQNNSRLHTATTKFNQFSWNAVYATPRQEHFIDAVDASPDPWQLPGSYTSHWISWNKAKSTSCITSMQEMRFYWITLVNPWQYYHHLETLSNPKAARVKF